jgi:hypothetical protein
MFSRGLRKVFFISFLLAKLKKNALYLLVYFIAEKLPFLNLGGSSGPI